MLVRVGSATDVAPGKMRVFDVAGTTVNVASVDGHLYAFDDTCTHRGCSLAKGELHGTTVTARRDGRDEVGCIVLGHGADETKVLGWLETAASVPGFIGFAVGRTTFWNAVAGYVAKQLTRQEAASLVARRYGEWAAVFERAHAHAGAA